MVIGFLVVSVFQARKRAAAAEQRLANLELWASGVSPVIMGMVASIGQELVQEHIEQTQKETEH